nr:MAG TPA: hypothetical protein [Caudoviricetes sp.]
MLLYSTAVLLLHSNSKNCKNIVFYGLKRSIAYL